MEYIYNIVRATSGEDTIISAIITDEDGANVTDSCYATLFANDTELVKVYGTFDGEQWNFIFPADVTSGLKGRYFYSIGRNFTDMCFKTPIYFI